MLAVQHAPRMGSSQPEADPLLPFGYAVDPNQEPLFEAPDPAPGAPLLTDSDTKYLSSFFEDMTSSQYSMPSFGDGLNFSDAWLDLPQFMGSATTFAPHPSSLDHASTSFSATHHHQAIDVPRTMSGPRLMPLPPPPSHAHSSHAHSYHDRDHPDDVLSAAATLLHNGNSRASTAKMTESPLARRAVGYPVGHLRHQPLEEFREETRRSSLVTDPDHTFTEWAWGPKERTSQRKVPLGDFQWGSDTSFGPAQGYAPDANKDSVHAMQQTQLKYLECLEVKKSAVNTRPASPVNGRAALGSRDGLGSIRRDDDQSAPPRKRRKSRNMRETVDEHEDEDDRYSFKMGNNKRRSRTEQNMSPQPSDAGSNGRRRKSNTNTSKPPRENLSEDQKRENHIRSEQKRRTLIKEGFDDLGELVPGLKGGGLSKSITLAMAAEWLEELLRGNKALSAQLVALNGKAT